MYFDKWPNSIIGSLIATSCNIDYIKGISINTLNQIVNKENITNVNAHGINYEISQVIYL
jgi:hypothetical protein